MTSKKDGILERLEKGVVLGAEGYLFELERRGYLKAGPFVPEVVLDHPKAVEQLHEEFSRAGSDVIEAFTYYAHRGKMKAIGRENDLEKLNRQALRIAKKIAKKGGALMAGNICNTWEYDPDKPKKTGKIVREMYREQIKWAKEEKADFIISETNDYLEEALIGLEVIKEYDMVAMINLATFQKTKTRDGYDYIKACQILEKAGADIVGFNCSRGPVTILPLLRKLRKAVDCYTAALPVPYRTTRKRPTFELLKENGKRSFPVALDPFVCTRFEMAEFTKKAVKIGINYIGVCCGAGPHHVRAMSEAIGKQTPSSRYSPDISLHPTFGSKAKSKDTKHLQEWS